MWVAFNDFEVLGRRNTDVVQMLSVIIKGGFRDVSSENFFRSETRETGNFLQDSVFSVYMMIDLRQLVSRCRTKNIRRKIRDP